jgi:hypothetical protein
VLILIIVAPRQYHVNRSIVISKPINEVFDYLKYIKNQDYWSPWKQKDPHMKQEFFGIDGEAGFVSKWEGNKDVGTGEQEIKVVIENNRIDTELRFFKPWKSTSQGYLTVEKLSDDLTQVEWGFYGRNPIPFNVFMLFFNMDKAVGKDFKEGLNQLKQQLEK